LPGMLWLCCHNSATGSGPPPPAPTAQQILVTDRAGRQHDATTISYITKQLGPRHTGRLYPLPTYPYINGDLRVDAALLVPPLIWCSWEGGCYNVIVVNPAVVYSDDPLDTPPLALVEPGQQTVQVWYSLSDTPDSQPVASSDKTHPRVKLLPVTADGPSATGWEVTCGEFDMRSEPLVEDIAEVPTSAGGHTITAIQVASPQLDNDNHCLLSPFFRVQIWDGDDIDVPAVRQIRVALTHESVSPEGLTASDLQAMIWAIDTGEDHPVAFGSHDLTATPGEHEDEFTTATLTIAGHYWLVVHGQDGSTVISKSGMEHPVPPALETFTVPAATCVAGQPNTGGETVYSEYAAQRAYSALGLVDEPSWRPPEDACFYSARYPEGVRGGYLFQPPSATVVDALFEDDVVWYAGHATYQRLDTTADDPVTCAAIVAEEAGRSGPDESIAQLVVLETCYAGANSFCHHPPPPQSSPTIAEELAVGAGVDCVLGFCCGCPVGDEPMGWFIDMVCDDGCSVGYAYDNVSMMDETWEQHATLLGNEWVELYGKELLQS